MSFSHLILLAIIAIIVIPPDKLPEVARQIARFINDLRRATSGIWDDLKQEALLKPEDLMKHKTNSTIHQPNQSQHPSGTAPQAPPPTVSPEELAKAQAKAHEEYLKSIQVEEVAPPPPTPNVANAAVSDTQKKSST